MQTAELTDLSWVTFTEYEEEEPCTIPGCSNQAVNKFIFSRHEFFADWCNHLTCLACVKCSERLFRLVTTGPWYETVICIFCNGWINYVSHIRLKA
jgi:hypothetical protein